MVEGYSALSVAKDKLDFGYCRLLLMKYIISMHFDFWFYDSMEIQTEVIMLALLLAYDFRVTYLPELNNKSYSEFNRN